MEADKVVQLLTSDLFVIKERIKAIDDCICRLNSKIRELREEKKGKQLRYDRLNEEKNLILKNKKIKRIKENFGIK